MILSANRFLRRITREGGRHDSRSRSLVAAARPLAQWAAVLGDLQSRAAGALPAARLSLSAALAGALGACRHRRPHEAGGSQAPRDRGCHRKARSATVVAALT